MNKIKDDRLCIITKEGCNSCDLLKQFLNSFKKQYKAYDVKEFDDIELKEILDKYMIKTYPAVFIKGEHIGGYEEVIGLYR